MISSRVTQKNQTTIPAEIRKVLDLHGGDFIEFKVYDNKVIVRKAPLLDLEFVRALQQTVSEWDSQEDEKLYANL